MLACALFAIIFLVALLFGTSDIYGLERYINDRSGILTQEEQGTLERYLSQYDKKSTNQIVVLIVDAIEGFTLEEYAIRIATAEGIGQKDADNGVLLLFDMQNRAVRIEVGYGLEGVLSDAKTSRIIRETIIPRFQKGEYFKGVEGAIDEIVGSIEASGEDFGAGAEAKTPLAAVSDFVLLLFLLPLFVGVYALYRGFFSIARYKTVSSQKNVIIFGLFFVAFFVAMLSAINDMAAAAGISVGLGLVAQTLFVFVIPIIIAFLIGDKDKALFLFRQMRLKSRDRKIVQILELYDRNLTSFEKYRDGANLIKQKNMFEGFSAYGAKNAKNISLEDDAASYEPTGFSEDRRYILDLKNLQNKKIYEILSIYYRDEKKMPQIRLFDVASGDLGYSASNIREFKNLKDLNDYLEDAIGLWSTISALSLATKGSSSTSSSSSSSGGFSGGGGGFGGGGSSGRW